MYRSFLFLLFFLALTTSVSAQPDTTYVTSFDPNPADMYQTDKGKLLWSFGDYVYVVNGFVKPDWGRKNQVYKINANTLEIEKEIALEGPQGDMTITAYVVTEDGHIVVTGEWRDYAANNVMRMFLAKYTADLEEVWTRYYPDFAETSLYSEGIVETETGDYLFYLSNQVDPSYSELRVLKTDSSGYLFSLDTFLPDTLFTTYGHGNLVPTTDGNYLVSSKGVHYGDYDINTGVVHKMDTWGNPLWTWHLPFIPYDRQPPVCTWLPDGGGVLMWMDDTISTNPNIARFYRYMQGFDADGNLTWRRDWLLQRYQFVNNLKTLENEDIIGLGHYYEASYDAGKGWIFRTTSEGELLWQRAYSDSLLRPWSIQMELFDVTELDDGRLAATGYVLDSTDIEGVFNSNVVLLVMDSLGCVEPGCTGVKQYFVSTSEPLFSPVPLSVLQVYPNPTEGPFTVVLPPELRARQQLELRLYDASGRMLRRLPWPALAQSMDVSESLWAEGVYRLLLFAGPQPVASAQLIIQP
jgi:hypothetical protein